MCESDDIRSEIDQILDDTDVIIDTKRFRSEKWPVKKIELESIETIRSLYTPWYKDKLGRPTRYDASDATPVTVAEVAENIEIWKEKSERINHYKSEFSSMGKVDISLLLYKISSDQYIILDRNHRSVALVLSNVPFTARLLMIEGPLDEGALADLKYWLKG